MRWSRLTADPAHGPLPLLLLALTGFTGVVDAVSILGLGRVFVANMTGNVVFVGFAVAGAPGFDLAASLLGLLGFLLGAGFGGRLAARLRPDRAQLIAVAAVVELLLVSATTVLVGLSTRPIPSGGRDVAVMLLATACGAQNAVVRALAVPDLTTTVLTLTLTGIAADPHGGTRRPTSRRRIAAVLTMLAGAIAGAGLLVHAGVTAALSLGAAILAGVTVAAVGTTRQAAAWRTGKN